MTMLPATTDSYKPSRRSNVLPRICTEALPADASNPEPEIPAAWRLVRITEISPELQQAPTDLLRSALFRATDPRKRSRMAQNADPIATLGSISLLYTGPELDQTDLDVWLAVLDLFAGHTVTQMRAFSRYAFLQRLGFKNPSGKNYAWLNDTLDRLASARIRLETRDGRSMTGALILRWGRADQLGQYFIRLDPAMAPLFAGLQTWQPWQLRRSLKRPLSKWLLTEVRSHAPNVEHAFPVASLQQRCGSGAKRLFEFRRLLKAAMTELHRAGEVNSWTIDEQDRLTWTRSRQLTLF
jgi:hypothetical protein